MKVWIGIDNGITGSIGVIRENKTYSLFKTPTIKERNYQKKAQNITRVDGVKLHKILNDNCVGNDYRLFLERPLVNPQRFKATLSAIRAWEATLIVINLFNLQYKLVDSRLWQHSLLPNNIQKDELKRFSLDLGVKLFPEVNFKGFKDADALLIAEWAKRQETCI